MGNFPFSKKTTILLSFIASSFSILTLATISLLPIDNANALTCAQVDASSNGECKRSVDRSESGFTDCISSGTNPNCVGTYNVNVQNNLNSAEQAKIRLYLTQLLDCDVGTCSAPPASNPNAVPTASTSYSLNKAHQNVDVKSLSTSKVDFEFDGDIDQINNGDGQDRFNIKNIGQQDYKITAADSSKVFADGLTEFDIDQTNEECDDARCDNTSTQEYDLRSSGTSTIALASANDLDGTSGFYANQLNNGCDDDDTGLYSVACINNAKQLLQIFTTTGGTANAATVKYDTIEIDDSAENGQNAAEQTNDCSDFALRTGVIGQRSDDCINGVEQTAIISAGGSSSVILDDMVSDADQTNNCDVDFECTNDAQVLLSVLTADRAKVTGTGEQNVDQYSDCDNRADCSNDAFIQAGIGFDGNGAPLAVNGASELNTEFTQQVDQDNYCSDGASCTNEATMTYFVTARGGADVNSISDQHIIQINECSGIQICFNDGTLTNHVFASGANTELDGTSSQTLYQSCDGSADTCMNTNNLRISTQALSGALLTYDASQDVTNQNENNQGDSILRIGQSGGSLTVSPATQTSPPQNQMFGNSPPP
jgi:hypothetical protein